MGTVTAPWKRLLCNSIMTNSHRELDLFQLATISSDGTPANRTMEFRGFLDATDKIRMNTDGRSHKINDLVHCPFAEICWYFSDSWEQFRINGKVDVIGGTNSDPIKVQQRKEAWFASSPESRLQYLGPNPNPGDHSLADPVDYLDAKINKRMTFSRRKIEEDTFSWTSENVNP